MLLAGFPGVGADSTGMYETYGNVASNRASPPEVATRILAEGFLKSSMPWLWRRRVIVTAGNLIFAAVPNRRACEAFAGDIGGAPEKRRCI
jgi:hypothetical protein